MSFWTDERVQILRAGFASGLSASLVAVQIGGVSRNAVIGKAARLGIVKGVTTKVMTKGDGKRLLTPSIPISAEGRRGPYRLKSAPAPTPIAEAPPLQPIAEPVSHPVKLVDLREHHCRWIPGDPIGAETLFCGAQATHGSYCTAHRLLAYRAPEIRARRRPQRAA